MERGRSAPLPSGNNHRSTRENTVEWEGAERRSARSLSGIRNHNLDLVVRAALSGARIGSWNPVISLVAFGSSPGHFSQPRQGFCFLVPYDICQARAERNSLSKLWVRQISFHSARTFCN